MRGPLRLVLVLATALLPIPVSVVASQVVAPPLTLELYVFKGQTDVTRQSRVAVHLAGERGEPLTLIPAGTPAIAVQLPAGLYDVQATHLEDRQVRKIRWALRLVLMPYPDEHGRHVEVINLENGFGGLEVLPSAGALPAIQLFPAGARTRPIPPAVQTASHVLYVVPAGPYDLHTGTSVTEGWRAGIDVPADRTRVWVAR